LQHLLSGRMDLRRRKPSSVRSRARFLSESTLRKLLTLVELVWAFSALIISNSRWLTLFVEDHILTLNLSVVELPQFHLSFLNQSQLEQWQRALLDINSDPQLRSPAYEDKQTIHSDVEDDDYPAIETTRRVSSVNSNYSGTHGDRSVATAATEYSSSSRGGRVSRSMHIPIDMLVVIPISSSMQGLKINLLRDCLKFVIHSLGDKDRLGLVTFGSSGGGVPLTGLTTKSWTGWPKVISSIRPVGQKSLRADVVEGANVAMDLLMQRKSSNPIGSILLISDSQTLETEAVDFVVSRAEAAKYVKSSEQSRGNEATDAETGSQSILLVWGRHISRIP